MLLSPTTAHLVRARVALGRGDAAKARAALTEAESVATRLAVMHAREGYLTRAPWNARVMSLAAARGV